MKWPGIKNIGPDGGISNRSVLYQRGSNCFVGFLFVYFEFLILPSYFLISKIVVVFFFFENILRFVSHIYL